MASGKSGKDRHAQEARERTRVYKARLELHEAQSRRRLRDNVLVGVVGGLVVVGAIASQFVYYGVGPGAPTPTATTPAPTVAPSLDGPTPGSSESPESGDPSPAPSDTPVTED